MKLFYTKTSPYARKVRIMLHEKGLNDRIEFNEVNLRDKPEALFAANPLGKIPALVLDHGSTLIDSPVICEYLETLVPEPRFYPQGDARFHALALTALADGIMDSAIAIFMEKLRPEELHFEKIIAKHYADIARAVAALEAQRAVFEKEMNIAAIAACAALAYVSFRRPEIKWQADAPALAQWHEAFSARESIRLTQPPA